MLSREDRILSELIVSRGLAEPAVVERRARELEDSDEKGLARALVTHGELDRETGRRVSDEAREIDDLLQPDLPEGHKLGEFRLVREIGRGGMGIVYEAVQESLGRRVALKVLPAGAALDERLAIRFLREARTAARLQHPGIVPVFGTGHEHGVLFFAMELVEGESLAERIERSPVPPDDAARIASEVAHALQHAHEAGLIHRDVKPDNVIIGEDGRARLADFGLVHDLQGARLTRSHYVLGTPAYSAPEQARGEPVDPRSDVYGVGAVLYSMLSGEPPFAGEVAAAVLGRLVSETPPPLSGAAPGAPRALVAICERAMARLPARRHDSPGRLAEELDRFLERDADADVSRPGPKPRRWLLGAAGFAALLIVVGLYLAGRPDRAAVSAPARTAIPAGLLDGTFRLLPSIPGLKRGATLSPDGETIVFTSEIDGESRIYLQRLDSTRPEPAIPAGGPGPQSDPAWSPDGRRLAYCRGQSLEIVDLASGEVETVSSPCGRQSWSPDGRKIVHSERGWPASRLRMLDLESGSSRPITGPGSAWPSWSPDGKRIAYIALSGGQYDVWTLPVAGGEPRRVTNDGAWELRPVWAADGERLVFGSDRDGTTELWSARVDTSTGDASEPVALTRGWAGARFVLSTARQRERLSMLPMLDLCQLWELRLDSRGEPVGPPRSLPVDLPFDVRSPWPAPDRDDWIVVAPAGEALNLHRLGPDASTFSRITRGPHRDDAPRWSPDGSLIAFHSDRSGKSEIWTVRPDGTELTRRTTSEVDARFPVFSPDGRHLAYTLTGRGPWVVSLDDGKARALAGSGELPEFVAWSWSPDGERLAGGRDGIVILGVNTGEYAQVTRSGDRPVWLDDSRQLLFTHEDRILHWRPDAEPRVIWTAGPSRLASSVSLGQDGAVYFAGRNSTEEIWILDP